MSLPVQAWAEVNLWADYIFLEPNGLDGFPVRSRKMGIINPRGDASKRGSGKLWV
jgi:hypothetical protein